jgi:hypothetical protein
VENIVSLRPVSPSLPERAATVVPLRGNRLLAPNSLFVRARMGDGTQTPEARAGVAFFSAACDRARAVHGAESRWWAQPLSFRVADIASDALLPLPEAEAAFDILRSARLLSDAERGLLVDADVLAECPSLAWFDFDQASACLRAEGRLAAPAVATLREIVRLADAEGMLATTIPHLLESLLYGRTRLTQALGVLERLGWLVRRDAPNRMVHLHLRFAGASSTAEVRGSSPGSPRVEPRGKRMRLPTNASLQVGGEVLELIPGVHPELEIGADGRYYVWLGPVRLGPYDP